MKLTYVYKHNSKYYGKQCDSNPRAMSDVEITMAEGATAVFPLLVTSSQRSKDAGEVHERPVEPHNRGRMSSGGSLAHQPRCQMG